MPRYEYANHEFDRIPYRSWACPLHQRAVKMLDLKIFASASCDVIINSPHSPRCLLLTSEAVRYTDDRCSRSTVVQLNEKKTQEEYVSQSIDTGCYDNANNAFVMIVHTAAT